jgi:hypothetical protein
MSIRTISSATSPPALPTKTGTCLVNASVGSSCQSAFLSARRQADSTSGLEAARTNVCRRLRISHGGLAGPRLERWCVVCE